MSALTVKVLSSDFQRKFQRVLKDAKNPETVLKVVGREGRNLLVKHFRDLDRRKPNKLGGKRDHFWLAIGRSVQSPQLAGNRIRIEVSDPRLAQKVFGGKITAKRKRNVAIPLTAESYGRAPATFEEEKGLKLFVVVGERNAFLATVATSGVAYQYVLKPWVMQQPEPEALPDPKEMQLALIDKAREVVADQARKENQQ